MQIRPEVEQAIVDERLLDWLIVSIDGSDAQSYRRYRIGGDFDVAFSHLARFHRRAAGTGIRVVWQYVVFTWNDSDDQFWRAIVMAEERGIPLWFDFAHTWGRSRRRAGELRYLTPYLKQAKQNGAFIAVVDPVNNFSAQEIDLHIPVYPGADLPVALAMIGFWKERELLDGRFLAAHATHLEPLLEAAGSTADPDPPDSDS